MTERSKTSETRQPGFAEIAKRFINKVQGTIGWRRPGVWHGGEKNIAPEDAPTIELAKGAAAEALADIFKIKNGIQDDERRIDHFKLFVHRYFENKRLPKLHKIFNAGRNGSIAQVTRTISDIYYNIEDEYLREVARKEFNGENPSEVLRRIRKETAGSRKEIRSALGGAKPGSSSQ